MWYGSGNSEENIIRNPVWSCGFSCREPEASFAELFQYELVNWLMAGFVE